MKMKQVYSIAMAGAMALGVALGSGMPAYAAQEDWIKVDTDSAGNRQPSVSAIDNGWGGADWRISYGYAVHPGYKYVLRICDQNTREWGKSPEGYGYYEFEYWYRQGLGAPEAGAELEIPWALDDLESLLSYEDALMTHAIPANQELFIYGYTGMDDWADVFATGYIMVYDPNGNLVDTFPLQSQPADNTTVPAADTAVPAADTTVPAADVTVPVADTTVPAANIQPSATDTSSNETVERVAKEVLRGKWGVGKDRRNRLEAAGYNYSEVQKKVYELMRA